MLMELTLVPEDLDYMKVIIFHLLSFKICLLVSLSRCSKPTVTETASNLIDFSPYFEHDSFVYAPWAGTVSLLLELSSTDVLQVRFVLFRDHVQKIKSVSSIS